MRSLYGRIRRYVPTIPMILFILLPIALLIHGIGVMSPTFADFFNIHISSAVRAILAHITGWFPFSLAESIILFLPIAAVAIVVFVTKKSKYDMVGAWRAVISLLSVIAYIYVSFVFTFALGYQGTSLSEKLDMERRKITAEEIYFAATALTEIVNDLSEEIEYAPSGSSIQPYGHSELVKKLNDAYVSVSEKYEFIPRLRSNVKQIVLSEPMTYTHISGVYTFFTGESNLNTNFPDYTEPYTVAHEMSHQRGIAPENEANFMAFLVCMESDDPYIRYSGAQNLLEYVYSALRKADKDLYRDCYYSLDVKVRKEMAAYNAFYEKYKENTAAAVSGAVNDTYLKLQGTEGAKSYGLVADLAVIYFYDGYYNRTK